MIQVETQKQLSDIPCEDAESCFCLLYGSVVLMAAGA